MSADPADASLCVGCGMCCDGTLFGHVALADDEHGDAEAAGLALVRVDERLGFLQPCPCFAEGACTIYARRPAPCRRYRCATLQALEAGDIALGEARRRVAQAKAAIAELPGGLAATRQALAEPESHDPREALALARVELLLDRHFRRPDRRRLSGESG